MPGIVKVDAGTLRRLLDPLREVGARRNQPLESRCVQSLDWEPDESGLTGDLVLEFTERGTYKYSSVPLEVFVDFAQAESQGRYFNLYIRQTYSYERIA